MKYEKIGKKNIPADVANWLLENEADSRDEVICVDMGQIVNKLEGSLIDYAAYMTHSADAGTVTFNREQLVRDAAIQKTEQKKPISAFVAQRLQEQSMPFIGNPKILAIPAEQLKLVSADVYYHPEDYTAFTQKDTDVKGVDVFCFSAAALQENAAAAVATAPQPKAEPKPILKKQALSLLREGDKQGSYCYLTKNEIVKCLGLNGKEAKLFEQNPKAIGIKKTLNGAKEKLYGFLIVDLEGAVGLMDPSKKNPTTVGHVFLEGHISRHDTPTKSTWEKR